MTETGLIVAQAVFLVLLYLFVWTVVRSSSRQLRASTPPPAPPPPAEQEAERRRVARREPVAVVPPAPPAPPPAPLPPPVELPQPTAEPMPALAGATREQVASEDPTEAAAAAVAAGAAALDLAANIDPRLVVVESSVLEEEREIALEGGLTIGRSGAAALCIADQFVSHMHARILRRGPYYFVEDLGSTNGTFLNGRRIERDAQLKVRDSLRIGQTTLRYEE